MGDTKIFICCHKKGCIPKHPLMKPIQVGTALVQERFEGYLHDNEGTNISEKNRAYCELTAQYWAWKNVDAEYYGFFHYRRFLYPDLDAKRPYRIESAPTKELLDKLGYDDFEGIITSYDVIVPIGEEMYVPVREHYAMSRYHHRKDLELTEQIILKQYPQMKSALESYLSGTVNFFGNIYIMKQHLFFQYCEWLFPILKEFDLISNTEGYGVQEKRVDGYLAERLFGIWLTYYRLEMRVCELPRVFFEQSRYGFLKKRLLNFLLPPGTKKRYVVKAMLRKMKWGGTI